MGLLNRLMPVFCSAQPHRPYPERRRYLRSTPCCPPMLGEQHRALLPVQNTLTLEENVARRLRRRSARYTISVLLKEDRSRIIKKPRGSSACEFGASKSSSPTAPAPSARSDTAPDWEA
jgi:hypothetical protein